MKKSSPKNLSADCRSTVGRQLTDRLPTANQQVTDRLIKKKNGGKNEQLTSHSVMVMYDSTDFTYLPINCYQLLSDAYRIYHLRNFYTTDNLRIALEDNLIENSAKNSENHKLRIILQTLSFKSPYNASRPLMVCHVCMNMFTMWASIASQR